MRFSRFLSAFLPALLLTLLTANSEAQSSQLPTRMVTVDGKGMRIWMAGLQNRKPGQPVVILESGAGGGLEHFKPIFDQIAQHAPVFAYDRRGLGQSELDTVPQTLDRVALSLHDLLREARVPPPYVLVGVSYGAALIRKFGTLFPAEVAGFVYLDATDFPTRAELTQLPAGALEAVFNLPPVPASLPPGMRAEIDAMVNHFATEFSEIRALRPPQDVPVAVIIAGAKTWPGISEDARTALLHLQIKHQSEWTQASPKGLVVVASKARHFLFNDEPALVIDTIRYVVRNAGQQPAR